MADTTIRIDKDAQLALVTIGGDVTAADLVEAARTLHARPDWDRNYNVIWDARKIASLVIGHDELIGVVDEKLKDSVGKEVAITSREVDHMIASLSALLIRARGREATVVATLEEALKEVGLERLPRPLEQAA